MPAARVERRKKRDLGVGVVVVAVVAGIVGVKKREEGVGSCLGLEGLSCVQLV